MIDAENAFRKKKCVEKLIECISIVEFGKKVRVTDFNQSSTDGKFTELVL